MEKLGSHLKKSPLEFAKTMIKKQFPKLAETDFDIEQRPAKCPSCEGPGFPEYWIKREQDDDFKRVPGSEMICTTCENKKLATESVERFKRAVSEKVTEQFWIVPPELENEDLTTYEPEDKSQRAGLKEVFKYLDEYEKGDKYNLLLRGSYGAGKSHLLKGVADKIKATTKKDKDGHNVPVTVGYISLEDLLNMVKGTWGRREGQTEQEIIRLAIGLDFLVIDDLGTESGEWAGKKLFEIINGRQGKPTAYTTNFMDLDELAKRYEYNGGKIVSRLYNNTKMVDLITKDMRKEKGRK